MKLCITKTLVAIQSAYEKCSVTKQEQRPDFPKRYVSFIIIMQILWTKRCSAVGKGRYVAYRSKFNGKRRKQFNLLMKAPGENRYYATS